MLSALCELKVDILLEICSF